MQIGPAFRRSVLEKDGKEVVGGVVLMRYGENPLEVTRAIKEKITALQPGLPEGVRIVPFYDRTPLIHGAIETVRGTVVEELIVCSLAILLVMGHLGGAFIVSITLPLAILFSFLMMRLFGVSSNIMSLSGIAISVGILIDQAVVMTENAAHHLSSHYGTRTDQGRYHGRRHPRLPDGRSADLLLGPDHDPLVPAGLRAFGPRGEALPPARLDQDVRADRRGDALDHAGPRAHPDLPQGADSVGGRELAGADDDRDLQADARRG